MIGELAQRLDDAQVEAVLDWMTFDMVRLSVADFERMFPAMNARQHRQIRMWLEGARDEAVIAGSAENKLDVFRVNKIRLYSFFAAAGFDVETAVRVEEARKTAAKQAAERP
jgi:hypothetical protein